MTRLRAAAVVAAGILASTAVYAAAPLRAFTPLAERRPAPEITLNDHLGRRHALPELKGKVVLVNFWASWCVPCRKEMPALERLWTARRNEAFMVLATDLGEDERTVSAFARRIDPNPSFPLLLDRDVTVVKAWSVRGMPTSFLVDKQGRIAFQAMGEVDFASPEVDAQLRALLRE